MESDLISRSTATANLMKQPKLTKSIVRRVLIQTPSADAVEVVRCKDCRHCLFDLSSREAHLCMRTENGWPMRRRRNADDFCSYGELRDNNE